MRLKDIPTMYDEYNDSLFENELPHSSDIEFDFFTYKHRYGYCFAPQVDFVIGIQKFIVFRKNENLVRLTLIHEMCHLLVAIKLRHALDFHSHNWVAAMVSASNKLSQTGNLKLAHRVFVDATSGAFQAKYNRERKLKFALFCKECGGIFPVKIEHTLIKKGMAGEVPHRSTYGRNVKSCNGKLEKISLERMTELLPKYSFVAAKNR